MFFVMVAKLFHMRFYLISDNKHRSTSVGSRDVAFRFLFSDHNVEPDTPEKKVKKLNSPTGNGSSFTRF